MRRHGVFVRHRRREDEVRLLGREHLEHLRELVRVGRRVELGWPPAPAPYTRSASFTSTITDSVMLSGNPAPASRTDGGSGIGSGIGSGSGSGSGSSSTTGGSSIVSSGPITWKSDSSN